MIRFRDTNRDQPFLLPPDIKQWLPPDDLAHFVIEACDRVDLSTFTVNRRGTGSEQYDPRMMTALLVYAYCNGVFSSRRVERATYRDIGFRYITGNTHPDHDTICRFRRNNEAAFAEAFHRILLLARELKLLNVGTVSVDGTKIDANASRYRSLRYDRAAELRERLKEDIADLIAQAEAADDAGDDPQALPEEIARREALKARLDEACERLEREARTRAEAGRPEYERKLRARQANGGKGRPPKPPDEMPRPEAQTNLTDPDSGLMRKNSRSEFRQAYNAQAVVDAEGSQMIVATGIGETANDKNELGRMARKVPEDVGEVETVLADAGYADGEDVAEVEKDGMNVLVAVGAGDARREYDFRPEREERPPPKEEAAWRTAMRKKLSLSENRAKYRLRKQTVEPVFGIIKEAMGFRRFRLRGLDKVRTEWTLVSLAYNVRRLHTMTLATP